MLGDAPDVNVVVESLEQEDVGNGLAHGLGRVGIEADPIAGRSASADAPCPGAGLHGGGFDVGKMRLERYAVRLGEHVFEGEGVEAGLLLMGEVGFHAPKDPRFLGTLAQIEKQLLRHGHVFRYATADDFGEPDNAFTICTFWYIDALIRVGRRDEARERFEALLDNRNPVGLLSEDIDVRDGALWGNFPQTYSMVGLINAAVRLSRGWDAVV